MDSFTRLVRFEDSASQTHYGEVGTEWEGELVGRNVNVYEGSGPFDVNFRLSEEKATISKILSPLPDVPIVIGVGLNYRKHAQEAGFPIPSFPVIFTKYADALAGPFDAIPIHPEAKELDYEGELSFIMGKDALNLSPNEDPLSYILGYTTGNDVSSRYWQNAQRSGSQHGYAKSFDKFAPVGPVIASTTAIPDPGKLRLRTWVNGQLRQDGGTDDLIFDVGSIVRHLSRGMTLRRGTVVMTGTPSGVAAFMKPPAWLRDGDEVEVEIEGIGRIRNKMVFEK